MSGRTHRTRGKSFGLSVGKFTPSLRSSPLCHFKPSLLALLGRHDFPRAVFPLVRFGRLPLAASRFARLAHSPSGVGTPLSAITPHSFNFVDSRLAGVS